MKYVDIVKSFISNNTLNVIAITMMYIPLLMVDDNDTIVSLWDGFAVFMYVLGIILMISPLHYKSYRILYNIYSRFPTWLQIHSPSIPIYLRRTYKTNIPDAWSTVVLPERNIHEGYFSYADWCAENVIGRYYVGQHYLNPDNARLHGFKVYFECEKEAFMFRMANA